MNKQIIYLTGFMASGKSTIAPILANTLGWDFYDLDREIEKREGLKVARIFKINGEKYFRKKETDTLAEISRGSKLIISLGGGALMSAVNREIVKSSGKLIYLKTSPEIAYSRLRFKRDRPALLFDNEEELKKENFIGRIKELLNQREKYYNEADYIIDTDYEHVGKTVDKIARLIENKFGN